MIRNIGLILTAIYLICVGLMLCIPGFAIPAVILGIIAVAAGIFLLLGK